MENGKCAIATGLTNGIGFGSSEFHVLRSTDKILNSYLFALLNTNEVRRVAEKNMTGSSGHRRVPASFYANMEIPLPPIDIQKKIADECKKVDEDVSNYKIELVKLSEKKRNLLSMSVITNFTITTLSQLCDMSAGQFVKASAILPIQKSPYIYPCYGGNGLRGFTNTMTNSGHYTLIGRQGALCGNVSEADGDFHATEHAIVVYPKDNVDSDWLFFFLEDMNLNQYATGVAQPGLSVNNILSLNVKVPESHKTREELGKTLREVQNRILEIREMVQAMPIIKQAILDKYLN